MGKAKPKPDRVRSFEELGTARIVRAVQRGVREALIRDAAYRRSKKKKKR